MVEGKIADTHQAKADVERDEIHLTHLDLSKLSLREIDVASLKYYGVIALNTDDPTYPLSKISQLDLSKLEYLNLDDNELTIIPPDLFKEMTSLKTLSIRRNRLKVLPNRIFRKLTNLEKLHLDDNKLENFPEGVFQSQINLLVLSLTSNRLTSIPRNAFYSLTNLRRLFLNSNSLETVPSKLFSNLENLELLFMKDNKLKDLYEDTFDKLFRLQRLNLTNNEITFLPHGIFRSQINLRVLFLDINQIEFLPGSLGVCTNLEILSQMHDENDYSFIKNSLKAKYPEYLTGEHYDMIEALEEVSKQKQLISVFEGVLYCIECGFENIPGDIDCTKCSKPLHYS